MTCKQICMFFTCIWLSHWFRVRDKLRLMIHQWVSDPNIWRHKFELKFYLNSKNGNLINYITFLIFHGQQQNFVRLLTSMCTTFVPIFSMLLYTGPKLLPSKSGENRRKIQNFFVDFFVMTGSPSNFVRRLSSMEAIFLLYLKILMHFGSKLLPSKMVKKEMKFLTSVFWKVNFATVCLTWDHSSCCHIDM